LLATLMVGVPGTLPPSGPARNLPHSARVTRAVAPTCAGPVSSPIGAEQRLSPSSRISYPSLSEVRVTYCNSVKSQVASRAEFIDALGTLGETPAVAGEAVGSSVPDLLTGLLSF
jgi:hypothetical protein